MSGLIRIAPGSVDAYTLLTTDSYLVTSWPIQTDMQGAVRWRASQPEGGEMRRPMRTSLSVGGAQWVGKWAGVIEIWALTGLMREYVNETILSSKPAAAVTAYVHSAEHDDYQVFYGELVSPHASEPAGEYARFSDDKYVSNRYLFRRAVLQTISYRLLESGDYRLMEDGQIRVLEQQ